MLSGMVLVEIFTPSRSSSVKFTIFLNPQAFSQYASAAKSSRSTFPQVHPSKAQCPSSDVPVHTISDSYPFPYQHSLYTMQVMCQHGKMPLFFTKGAFTRHIQLDVVPIFRHLHISLIYIAAFVEEFLKQRRFF